MVQNIDQIGQSCIPYHHVNVSRASSASTSQNNSPFSVNATLNSYSAFTTPETTPLPPFLDLNAHNTHSRTGDVAPLKQFEAPQAQGERWQVQHAGPVLHSQPSRFRPYPDVMYASNYVLPPNLAYPMAHPVVPSHGEPAMVQQEMTPPPYAPQQFVAQQGMGLPPPVSYAPQQFVAQHEMGPPPPGSYAPQQFVAQQGMGLPPPVSYAPQQFVAQHEMGPPPPGSYAPQQFVAQQEMGPPPPGSYAPQQFLAPYPYAIPPPEVYAALMLAQRTQHIKPASVHLSKKFKHNSRVHPDNDPDLKCVKIENGKKIYECKLPQCNKKLLQEGSVHNHRESNRHKQRSNRLHCQGCGEFFSRSDALKRHVSSGKCIRNQDEAHLRGSDTPCAIAPAASKASTSTTPPVTMSTGPSTFPPPTPGPSSVPQQTSAPPMPVFAQEFSSILATPEPSSVPQQTSGPPLPVFAQDFPEPSSVPQRDLALPVFAQDFTFMPVPSTAVAQKISGVPPLPVIAQDFSTNSAEEDDMGLFGSPVISASPALPLAPVTQEGPSDSPKSGASFFPNFDASVFDVSYEEWFEHTEQAAPVVYGEPASEFSPHYES